MQPRVSTPSILSGETWDGAKTGRGAGQFDTQRESVRACCSHPLHIVAHRALPISSLIEKSKIPDPHNVRLWLAVRLDSIRGADIAQCAKLIVRLSRTHCWPHIVVVIAPTGERGNQARRQYTRYDLRYSAPLGIHLEHHDARGGRPRPNRYVVDETRVGSSTKTGSNGARLLHSQTPTPPGTPQGVGRVVAGDTITAGLGLPESKEDLAKLRINVADRKGLFEVQ